jgi:nucleoside-diphosphate-sugar epimerase
MAELEVWRGMEEGLKTIIVNPSIVLGPGNWEDGSTRIFKYGFQEHLFYPKGNMNFVDVRDVAEIVGKLLSTEKAIGQRFILNAAAVPYKTIFELISKNFDKKSPGILAGPILSGIAWRAEAIKTFLTSGKPGITKETAKASQQNFYYKNSKIVNFLNYNFFSTEDTIKWVCGELRKKYNV